MSQLSKLKELVNPKESDAVVQYYLDSASDVICDLRDASAVESKYLNVQIMMAVELYNKRGAEGQTGHSENGVTRAYTSADISPNLLALVTPVIRTPWSTTRVIV